MNYDKLPNPDLVDGLRRYIEEGIIPGHFLTACLENDLSDAIGRADAYNLSLLPNIVRWLYNEAPGDCWGSPVRVLAWHEKHRPKKPGNRLDDGSNEEIADREDFDDHELDV